MVWYTPVTWTAGQLVTHTNFNQQIRDNLNMCLTPNFGRGSYTSGANHTTTSTSFGNVDATNITFNVTSKRGQVGGVRCNQRVQLRLHGRRGGDEIG